MSALHDNLGVLALVAGEELPFKTDEDRVALVGRSVFYLRQADIHHMGGKRHVFPHAGVVQTVDHSTLLFEDGMSVSAGDIRFVASRRHSQT